MKDLVDVVYYATNEAFSLEELARSIAYECSRRDMDPPEKFEAPDAWAGKFAAFARKNGVSEEHASFGAATSLASVLFDPALGATHGWRAFWGSPVVAMARPAAFCEVNLRLIGISRYGPTKRWVRSGEYAHSTLGEKRLLRWCRLSRTNSNLMESDQGERI